MSSAYQNPYMEQQFPFGQSPQTVPPLVTPHDPSVVTGALLAAAGVSVVVTGAITGSCVVDEEAARAGADVDAAPPAPTAVVVVVPSVHPLWQPFATEQ